MERQGVFIVDSERKIRVMTPVAEEILGWSTDQVIGRPCPTVFNCQDAEGNSLCDHCGFADTLHSHEISARRPVRMTDPSGARHDVMLSFWYLPPAGNLFYPRLLGVVECVEPASDAGLTASRQIAG
jgi:PAS domain-containing protein